MENLNRQSILEGDRTIETDLSFFDAFNLAASKNPSKSAVLYENDDGIQKMISYKCMDVLSNQIATVLQRICNCSELKTNSIAVSLRPTERLPVILLAIMKAGFAYLPIDVEFPVNRVKYILQDAEPLMLITEKSADCSMYEDILILTDEQLLLESEQEIEKIITNQNKFKDKIALVLYTSGSTGKPKGVLLQYTALMNRLMWQWKELPYKENEDYCVFKTALTFVDSVSEIWGPLLQSRTLIVVPSHVTKNPEKFIDILIKFKVQRIVLVPSLLKSMLTYLRLQQIKDSLFILKLWICSGEALVISLVQEFFLWFAGQNKIVANFYGSTEIMGDVTFYLIKETDECIKRSKIPIGKPINNCSVYIVDHCLNLIPNGEVGELVIAGKNVAYGYIGQLNEYKFINNPFSSEKDYSKLFRTGDLAKIENNLLFYEGRQDNQVKIRGHRINIAEIEMAALNSTLVEEVVVLPYTLNESNQILLCFIVSIKGKADLKLHEVKLHFKQSLPMYMIPEIIFIHKIPLLVNGKTDRQKLLEFYNRSLNIEEKEQNLYNFNNIPSEQHLKAKILFSTIASITGLKNTVGINVNSNFYELGGNSLNSVYAVLKLREQGYDIKISDFITAKSMKDILPKMKLASSNTFIEDATDTQEILLEMLNDSHKNDVVGMITESFFTKADLERWLLPDIQKEDYFRLMQDLWKPLVQKNLSFVLKSSSNNKILSVSLNFDANDEPQLLIDSKLSIVFDFIEFLEKPIRDTRLPKGKNKIFHTFMMATSNDLSSAENVLLMKIMEEKCLDIAKKKYFHGILTTNTSPLTQQLGTDVFKYEIMLNYQVNQYVTADGLKPFLKAPDDQRAIVSWKTIDYNNK